jgi:hypothetical protein
MVAQTLKTPRAAKIGGPEVKIGLWTTMGGALLTAAAVACAQGLAEGPASGDDTVVATIGEEVITESELEAMTGPSLVALRQQIYQARIAKLEAEIYQRLVRKAAAAEGMEERAANASTKWWASPTRVRLSSS